MSVNGSVMGPGSTPDYFTSSPGMSIAPETASDQPSAGTPASREAPAPPPAAPTQEPVEEQVEEQPPEPGEPPEPEAPPEDEGEPEPDAGEPDDDEEYLRRLVAMSREERGLLNEAVRQRQAKREVAARAAELEREAEMLRRVRDADQQAIPQIEQMLAQGQQAATNLARAQAQVEYDAAYRRALVTALQKGEPEPAYDPASHIEARTREARETWRDQQLANLPATISAVLARREQEQLSVLATAQAERATREAESGFREKLRAMKNKAVDFYEDEIVASWEKGGRRSAPEQAARKFAAVGKALPALVMGEKARKQRAAGFQPQAGTPARKGNKPKTDVEAEGLMLGDVFKRAAEGKLW